ncbi:MAG: hypothetical protein Q7K54_04415 [Candidatus Parcubacteria bacterium]|nr:hypothetical protein [Candidatus Parcubacteria bacterium]
MNVNIFNKLSFLSLFLVIVLLPFFFLPFTNIPIETSKGVLLVVGLVFSVIFWAIARFIDGKISLPRSASLLGALGIVVAVLLSAFFSKTSQVSFFGTMFDLGSFWFIFAGLLLLLMSSIVFKESRDAKIVLFGLILSSIFVLLFQSLHLFLPKVLTLGILVEKTDNLIGSWNAFGIFAGFFALMSILIVEFFPTTKVEKFILQILTVLAVILIAAVNFPFVWGILGVATLIIFVYKISISSVNREEGHEKKYKFPLFSFAIIMISLLFFTVGSFIGNILPNRLGLSNAEVSPSLGATIQVAKSVLKENPVFGIGPNKFGIAWSKYKPAELNATNFWDVSFNSGSGTLPTFTATTGYLSILAWLVFFVLLIVAGVKSIFSSIKHGVNWETMAFFVLSVYLFVSSFFYSTGAVLFLLALAFAGIFIGLSSSSRSHGEISMSFLNDHRKSFFSILSLILLIVASAAISFKYIERVTSLTYFRKALTASTVPIAETNINKALSLNLNDLYLRTYSQIYLVKLNEIVKKGESALTDEDKTQLQTNLGQAVNGAQSATSYNNESYLNFANLGSVYQIAGSLGVKDGYANAIEAYKVASTLNPQNPGIKLALANISLNDGKAKDAENYVKDSLTLKSNYLDAWIVLSQIVKSEGNNADALYYAQVALSLSPEDKNLKQYVESLKTSASAPATVADPTLPAPSKTKK